MPFFLALILGITSPTASPSIQDGQTKLTHDTLMVKAAHEFDTSNYIEASKTCDLAVPLEPNDERGWLLKALTDSKRDWTLYMSDLRNNLLKRAMQDYSTGYNLIQIKESSLTEHDQALKKAQIVTERGKLEIVIVEPLRAYVDALWAEKLDPKFAGGWTLEARAFFEMGELELAKARLATAKGLDPSIKLEFNPRDARDNANFYRKYSKRLDPKVDVSKLLLAANQHLDQYEKEPAKVDYSSLVKENRAIAEINPMEAVAWENLGFLESRKGSDPTILNEAIQYYTVAETVTKLKGDPIGQALCLKNRAGILVRAGRFFEAQTDLLLAKKLDSTDPEIQSRLSKVEDGVLVWQIRSHISANDTDGARNILSRRDMSKAISPELLHAAYEITSAESDAFERAKNFSSAEKQWTDFIALDPKGNYYSWGNRARVRGRAGNRRGAIEDISAQIITHLLDGRPYPSLLIARSEFWRKNGEILNSLIDAQLAIQMQPDKTSVANFGDACYAIGDYEMAKGSLKSTGGEGPWKRDYTAQGAKQNEANYLLHHKNRDHNVNIDDLFTQSANKVDRGYYQEAIAGLIQCTELRPENLGPFGLLGVCYSKVGNADRALECLSIEIALDNQKSVDQASSTSQQITFLPRYALVFSSNGRFYEAINCLELALKLAPTNENIAIQLRNTKAQFAKTLGK